MAEIMKKIGKVLQEQAIPAAQRLQTIISNLMEFLHDKAEKLALEINTPPKLVAKVKNTTDRAENHMYSPVPTAQGGETVSEVSQRLASLPSAFDSVELLFVTDADQRLLGVVPLSKLLVQRPRWP